MFCYNMHSKTEIKLLQKFYLSVSKGKDKLIELLSHILPMLSIENQEKIIEATIENSISMKYPPPLAYRTFFLRTMIDLVEANNEEMSDKLLACYTNLLSMKFDNNFPAYCTYIIDDSTTITLQENQNFVVNGTTGLRTWEAAKFMAEWCVENRLKFQNKSVLELGSGSGLLGLVVWKFWQPEKFIFTDKSEDVLHLLRSNIQINVQGISSQISAHVYESNNIALSMYESGVQSEQLSKIHFITHKNQKNLEVQYLDWKDTTEERVKQMGCDIVLGTDIVFDPSIIEGLVKTIHLFLINGASYVYIASTIRNEDTDLKFCQELDSMKIFYEELPNNSAKILLYDRNVHFKLYKISLQ